MQIFNLKKSTLQILVFALGMLGFCESTNSMMEMPTISMPELSTSTLEMPTISSPKMNGSVYQPSVPGVKKTNQSATTEKSSSAVANASISNASNPDDLLSDFLKSSSTLTASDISSLYDSGLFNNISSITNVKGNVASNSTVSTNALLQQILSDLEELKSAQKNNSQKQNETIANLKQDSETFKNRNPSILRFKINGYNVTDSFSTVFFSETDADGSFLLSADRKYYANQKPRTETLYILFKSQKNCGSNITYLVQPRIVQDVKNENSYVYKMSQSKSLIAEKTGNLVVIRSEDPELSVDLLLDLDK